MKQRIAIATALVGLAAILGATVFRDQVALAAQSIDAHITNVDGNGNIKVHEQGTPTVAISPTANTVQTDLHLNTPFVVERGFDVSSSGGDDTTAFTVPAGKVFVLQHVTAIASADPGVNVGLAGMFRLPDNTPPDSRGNANYPFNLVKRDTASGSNVWSYSQNDAIAIYAGANTITFGATGDARATVVFSGYLADLPA